MSSVFFVSDLHLGHRNILKYTGDLNDKNAYRGGTTVEEHDQWVIDRCMSVNPNKNTYWWILGDVAMNMDCLYLLERLPGRKTLVMGNHDTFPTAAYLPYFERLVGIHKKYGFWISHAPIHQVELRGKPNLHGHMHHNDLWWNPRYFNTCFEWLPEQKPISLEELREVWMPGAMEALTADEGPTTL